MTMKEVRPNWLPCRVEFRVSQCDGQTYSFFFFFSLRKITSSSWPCFVLFLVA